MDASCMIIRYYQFNFKRPIISINNSMLQIIWKAQESRIMQQYLEQFFHFRLRCKPLMIMEKLM